MSNRCTLIPEAPNGNPSKLFTDLIQLTGNREIAKQLWAFTRTDLFQSEFSDIKMDENGEPQLSELSDVMGLDTVLNGNGDTALAKELGISTATGSPVSFQSAKVAMEKADQFNDRATNRIAVAEKKDDGNYVASISERTPLEVAKADQNKSRGELHKALISILNRIGFDVTFDENPDFQGIFDPLNAEENARGLKTVIRVAHGQEGMDAIPEETAHLILAGMKNHPLRQRLDDVMTDDVVRRVLGDEYNSYVQKYRNYRTPLNEMLREEAEGKLFADVLKGRQVSEQHQSLLKRIWNWVKSKFAKLTEHDIDNAIANAKTILGSVRDVMERDDLDTVLDMGLIENHEAMYELNAQMQKLADIAQEGESMLSKKLYIIQNTQSKADTKGLRRTINDVRENLENQKYVNACCHVLLTIGTDVKGLMREAAQLGWVYNNTTNLNVIAGESSLLNKISTALQAYTPYLETLATLPQLVRRGEIVMDMEDAESIAKNANEHIAQLNNLKADYRQMRFSVLKQLISLYYGDNGGKPENFEETEYNKWESVDAILSHAKCDISAWDTSFFSAGDSRNPLINVIHNIVVRQQASRNTKINRLTAKMQEAERKLHAAGHDNKFVYQYDAEGKPTGFYVAPVDMARYERERQEFLDSLEEKELDYYEEQKAIQDWDDQHTDWIELAYTDQDGDKRMERLPKREIYGVPNFQQGWDQAQKDYYDTLLEMKMQMDSMLPGTMHTLYLAPQVRKSVSQMFDKDGHGALKTIWGNWKKKYTIVDDNEDYGKDAVGIGPDGKKYVLLDFAGNHIKRVPIYFIHKLKDQADLSTDATHAMFNYISMAVNYSEMGQLAQAMQLLQEHVKEDYEVGQEDAGKPMIDMFRALGRKYQREYRKTGEGTRTVQQILKYIDRQFFNETKNKMGNVNVFNPFTGKDVAVSKDSCFNLLLYMTSISRMGINVLSGITNASQGELQMLTEAMTKRYFGLKELIWAKKEYGKLLPQYMGDFNSIDRHDKMYMLINQFNSSEDFFRDMKDKDFNQSAGKRLLGRGNIYFLNTMGEHYLHTSGMLMVLKNEKVKRASNPKETVSLYDVITQVHDENGWHLELDDDIEFVDKNRSFLMNFSFGDKPAVVKKSDRDKLFENLAVYINKINADMHGGYSEAEKGNANQQALWRAALQFRQWMFGMYNKLYSGSYYDAVNNVQREGGYVTMYKFLKGVIADLHNMGLKAAIENNKLTVEEKQNAALAAANAILFTCLMIMCRMTAGWKDKDDRALRMLAYNIKRLELETGALNIAPLPDKFIKNIFTLIQSPAAGISTLESATQLFNINSYLDDIDSGRYKGWPRALKSAYTLSPIYNIQKVIDMRDYNYMFNIFN